MRGRSDTFDGRQDARLERPLRARSDGGPDEADRGQVAFADRAQAQGDPGLPGQQSALIRVQDRARIAQRHRLDRVLRGESRPQQQGPGRRQFARVVQVRADDRRMGAQQVQVVAVAVREVHEQLRHELLDLRLGHCEHPGHDRARARVSQWQLLAGQEQPGDHPARVRRQTGLEAMDQRGTHGITPRRRACWAVEIAARVDSAP